MLIIDMDMDRFCSFYTSLILLACFDIIYGVHKKQTFYAMNDIEMQDVMLVLNHPSKLLCGRHCLEKDGCYSFGFTESIGLCKLFDTDPLIAASESSAAVGSVLFVRDCQEGWLKFGESCYKFSNTHKSWVNSKTYCESLGANLAIVTYEAEHQFIRQTIAGRNKPYFWIGAQYSNAAGEYRWIDGTEMTFNGWKPGQPAGGSGCVDYLGNANWLWNHHGDCYTTNGPCICEKKRV